jgi:acetyl esterase/lipase
MRRWRTTASARRQGPNCGRQKTRIKRRKHPRCHPVLRDRDGVGSTELYLNGNDPRQPYLSPLFSDLATAFPPTHLITGTRDRLLSDTVRMHAALRAAGIEADLFAARPCRMPASAS